MSPLVEFSDTSLSTAMNVLHFNHMYRTVTNCGAVNWFKIKKKRSLEINE